MSDSTFSRRYDYEERRKLTDSAYDELRQAIVELRFQPGELLRESGIGRELGISKTPVREALLKLEHDGMVELIPFRGARVSGYDADDVREILELRAILQGECVRRVAEHSDEEMIKLLRENVAESREAMRQNDFIEIIALFDAFDTILMSELDNRRAVSLIGNLQDHMKRIGQLTAGIPGRNAKSIEEHSTIVDALEQRDPEAASEAMRRHIESVLADEIASLRVGTGDEEVEPTGEGGAGGDPAGDS